MQKRLQAEAYYRDDNDPGFHFVFLFLPVLADYYVSALMRAASRVSWAPTPLNPKRKVKTTRKVIKTSVLVEQLAFKPPLLESSTASSARQLDK